MFETDQPIAALASAAGGSAEGIVRISGRHVKAILSRIFSPEDRSRWEMSQRAAVHAGEIKLSDVSTALPVRLYLWPDSRSYTGQPMAEIHTVGAPPLLEALLTELYQQGVRPARPGEFTLRSFLAGRIDLVQAEAVLGVIDAEDHLELQSALSQLAGGISVQLSGLQADLLDLLADLEAGLDFVDEDIEFVQRDDVIAQLEASIAMLEMLVAQAVSRMQTTGRRKVVLAGLPNAGKSTLFNLLVQQEAAIVSEMSGTTRDYLCAQIKCGGFEIDLIDTAGWDQEATGIEKIAQTQRSDQIDRADLVLWCCGADLGVAEADLNNDYQQRLRLQTGKILNVLTKSDLLTENNLNRTQQNQHHNSLPMVLVSAQTGEGMEKLMQQVVELLGNNEGTGKLFAGSTAARCRESLAAALLALQSAKEVAETNVGDEILSIEIRETLEHLGRILGSIYTDDILDRVFSKFCIGK